MSSRCSSVLHRTSWLLACAGLACALSLHARSQSHVEGEWAGPWSYENYLAPFCPGTYDELSHAALLPTGTQKGKVLLWRWQLNAACQSINTTTVWVFDPQNPAALIAVPGANLTSDILAHPAFVWVTS